MIEEVIKLSPVPVVFVADDKLEPNEGGCYSPGSAQVIPHWPVLHKAVFNFYSWIGVLKEITPYIKISDSLSYHEKTSTLLHEIGHALCWKKNCDCCWKNKKYREIHADEYALNWLLENNLSKSLQKKLLYIKCLSEQNNYHGEAARHTMKTELWIECIRITR